VGYAYFLNLPRSGLVQHLFGRIRLSRTEAPGCPHKSQRSPGCQA
jgi:hypothetical protein